MIHAQAPRRSWGCSLPGSPGSRAITRNLWSQPIPGMIGKGNDDQSWRVSCTLQQVQGQISKGLRTVGKSVWQSQGGHFGEKAHFPEEEVASVGAGRIPQWLDVVPKELPGMRGRERRKERVEMGQERRPHREVSPARR